jgi:hypothetical protein
MALAIANIPNSVQEHEQASKSSVLSPMWYQNMMANSQAMPILPAWGNPARLYQLRRLWYEQRNTLVVGALVGLKNSVVQTPWELIGPKTRTPYFQDIFQGANAEMGFGAWLSQMSQDYLNLDSGAVSEIAGPGAPDTPLRDRVTGLNALDGLRCYHTGDPEFPIYYQSHISGKLHKLHKTRIMRWVDSPSPDPAFKGLGLSAMSRAANVAQVMMMLAQYEINTLDDVPARGILAISGIVEAFYLRSKDNFVSARQPDKITLMQDLLELTTADPAHKIDVQLTKFSEMPQGATSETILRNQVNLLALAIGVDPQDIFPLASSAMGSGQQSSILHQKGKGKSYGLMLTDLERLINTAMLPRKMEFKWKSHDAEEDQQEAQTAQTWAGMTTSLLSSGVINQGEARKLLANNVEAFGDLLLDEAGQVRLPDNDPKEANPEVVVEDNTPVGTEPDATTGEKALGDTQAQFEAAIGDLFAVAVSGAIERRRFGVVARGLIATYGRKAYRDGLKAGGADASEISDEELVEISQLAVEQSQYVTAVGEAIYKDGTVSPAQAAGKPQLWWNKSIMPFYQAGLVSADKNGNYEFQLGATEAHCIDCQRLNKQVHRLRNWMKSGWLPQASKLTCGGWQCDCHLVKTTREVSGSY